MKVDLSLKIRLILFQIKQGDFSEKLIILYHAFSCGLTVKNGKNNLISIVDILKTGVLLSSFICYLITLVQYKFQWQGGVFINRKSCKTYESTCENLCILSHFSSCPLAQIGVFAKPNLVPAYV